MKSYLNFFRTFRRYCRSDRGALTVELIGIVPVVVLVALLCIQGLMMTALLPAVQQASRDGARAAVAGHAVRPAVNRTLPDWVTLDRIDTGRAASPHCAGHCVRVTVRVPIGVPAWTMSTLTIDRFTEMPR